MLVGWFCRSSTLEALRGLGYSLIFIEFHCFEGVTLKGLGRAWGGRLDVGRLDLEPEHARRSDRSAVLIHNVRKLNKHFDANLISVGNCRMSKTERAPMRV